MQEKELKDLICKVLDDKKGIDITVVDLEGLSIVADWFVIVSGRSTTQVKALAGNLEEELSKNYGIEPIRSDFTASSSCGATVRTSGITGTDSNNFSV